MRFHSGRCGAQLRMLAKQIASLCRTGSGAAQHVAGAAASGPTPGIGGRLGELVFAFQSDAAVDAAVFTQREEAAAEAAEQPDAMPYYWYDEDFEAGSLPAAEAVAPSSQSGAAGNLAEPEAALHHLAAEWTRLLGDGDEAASSSRYDGAEVEQLEMQLELEMRQHSEAAQELDVRRAEAEARVEELQRRMRHLELFKAQQRQLDQRRIAVADPGLAASVALPAEAMAPAPGQQDDDSGSAFITGLRSTTPSGQLSHTIRVSDLLWGAAAADSAQLYGEQGGQEEHYEQQAYGTAVVDLDEFANAVVADLNSLLLAIRLAACQAVLLASVMVLYMWASSGLEKRLERLEAAAAAAAATAGKVVDAV
jgi:hypothetical protein